MLMGVGFQKIVPIDNIVDFVDGYAYFKGNLKRRVKSYVFMKDKWVAPSVLLTEIIINNLLKE